MKIKIDRFVLKLLIENSLYIAGFILFIIIAAVFLPKELSTLAAQTDIVNQKTAQLTELRQLQERSREIIGFDPVQMDKIMKRMLPASEDYFSIFSAIDLLSGRSGIFVQSYTSPFGRLQGNVVKIELSGFGSYQSVEELLTDYHYKSGRLMTIDRIKFEPLDGKLDMSLNFFSAPESKPSTIVVPKISQTHLSQILKYGETGGQNLVTGNYSSKSDPFSLVLP